MTLILGLLIPLLGTMLGSAFVFLMKCMEGVKDDPTTYDLLKDYLKDEEEDLYWSQGAVELIEKIGTQNWLLLQL